MGLILAGALQGAGNFGAQLRKQWGAEELEKMREEAAMARQNALIEAQRLMETGRQTHDVSMVGVREKSRQAGRLADIEQDINPDTIAKKGAAASGLIKATLPARVEEKEQLGAAETKIELERFEKLVPVKRQAAIDDALAVLKAKSTPEALKQSRAIAMSTHIVDPSYTVIPNADGTVTTFDTKSGRSGGVLKDPDGNPIIRKDSEELKAATSVINMANTNLKIAQAEHKATVADLMATPAEKAAANAAWNGAQAEARRLSAPAYAVLYGKAKIPDGGGTAAETAAAPIPTDAHVSALKARAKNPAAIAAFESQYGAGSAAKYLGGDAAKKGLIGTTSGSHEPVADPNVIGGKADKEIRSAIVAKQNQLALEGISDATRLKFTLELKDLQDRLAGKYSATPYSMRK